MTSLGATCPDNAGLLQAILARPDVWRGDALAAAPLPGVATGFAALDAELPGGGWPRGGLVELLLAQSGIGELSLLMPALASLSLNERAWIACIAPPQPLFAPAWASAGVNLAQLVVTRAGIGDAAWACARVLDTTGVGALLAWLPACPGNTLRRLQILAERGRTLAFVMRPAHCADQPSPAPLRLRLDAGPEKHRPAGYRSLAVQVLKRRGGAQTAVLHLGLPRLRPERSVAPALSGFGDAPVDQTHALAGPALSAPCA